MHGGNALKWRESRPTGADGRLRIKWPTGYGTHRASLLHGGHRLRSAPGGSTHGRKQLRLGHTHSTGADSPQTTALFARARLDRPHPGEDMSLQAACAGARRVGWALVGWRCSGRGALAGAPLAPCRRAFGRAPALRTHRTAAKGLTADSFGDNMGPQGGRRQRLNRWEAATRRALVVMALLFGSCRAPARS